MGWGPGGGGFWSVWRAKDDPIVIRTDHGRVSWAARRRGPPTVVRCSRCSRGVPSGAARARARPGAPATSVHGGRIRIAVGGGRTTVGVVGLSVCVGIHSFVCFAGVLMVKRG